MRQNNWIRVRAFNLIVILAIAIYIFVLAIWIFRTHTELELLNNDPNSSQLEQFNATFEATKSLWGVAGTAATILGAVVLFLNFKVAEKSLKNSEYRFRKDTKLSESRLLTERLCKAIEQLESSSIYVRVGGIYSMERISRDFPEVYWVVMEMLTTFIRDKRSIRKDTMDVVSSNSQDENGILVISNHESQIGSMKSPASDELPEIATDIQAALTVICRRTGINQEFSIIDLRNVDLSGAFLEKANLESADLRGSSLRKAYLKHANLQHANLIGADLGDAYIVEANFREARLFYASLRGANLFGANLEGAFLIGADLEEASLEEANLQDSYLLKANLKNTLLLKTRLENVKDLNADALLFAKLCQTVLPGSLELDADRDCLNMGLLLNPNETMSSQELEN